MKKQSIQKKVCSEIAKIEGKKVETSYGQIEEVINSAAFLEFELRRKALEETGMADKQNSPAMVFQFLEARVQEYFKDYISRKSKEREDA